MILSIIPKKITRFFNFDLFLLFQWANDLASHLLTIHDDELSRRQDFSAIFENHFLNALFNGLDDLPPPFATRSPLIFDANLPNLCPNDLDALANAIPDITSKITLPDLKDLISFFSIRHSSSDKGDDSESKLLALRLVDIHAHLKEYVFISIFNIIPEQIKQFLFCLYFDKQWLRIRNRYGRI